jgi:hypothetical protein
VVARAGRDRPNSPDVAYIGTFGLGLQRIRSEVDSPEQVLGHAIGRPINLPTRHPLRIGAWALAAWTLPRSRAGPESSERSECLTMTELTETVPHLTVVWIPSTLVCRLTPLANGTIIQGG